MIEILERSAGSVLGLRVSGRVLEEDYDLVLPHLERVIAEHGEVDILCHFDGFTGMEPEAIWRDMKFYARHFRDLRRCAVVKDSDWQGTLATLLGPMASVETRVFEQPEEDAAWEWLFRKAEADRAWKDEDAGRRRAEHHRKRIHRLIDDLREDTEKLDEPAVKALFETASEVLGGVGKAFEHYEKRAEPAWREE